MLLGGVESDSPDRIEIIEHQLFVLASATSSGSRVFEKNGASHEKGTLAVGLHTLACCVGFVSDRSPRPPARINVTV
jgi:hypothetical protein